MEKVRCHGTVPGTATKCDAVIFYTNGEQFVIVAPVNRILRLDANPTRIKCRVCGYKNKLDWKDRKR
jgi:ribosomal protein L40E